MATMLKNGGSFKLPPVHLTQHCYLKVFSPDKGTVKNPGCLDGY